ncbi:exodeoxyribonuclease VII small subunit [Roseospirillum parvum]|uniref:Exodeoxyribonuclease 7 small subunit n=1 Tax=Roseospirillum parvum TaxID=83401 RepID=A0A1G8BNN9_9PROT|nr:exodeoxyribonuclease VII small subunit [Roseospirillum parvum]SDH34734.1 exodeoxyribonuclease VII small subunit [Roseospirillum parvum]
MSKSPAPPPAEPAPTDPESLSFEDALAELETIVRRLEGGEVRLDQAVGAYERGVALKRACERKLAEARLRVERISVGEDGAARVESAGDGPDGAA